MKTRIFKEIRLEVKYIKKKVDNKTVRGLRRATVITTPSHSPYRNMAAEEEDPTYSIVEYMRDHSGYKCGYCKSKNTNFSHGKLKL